VTGTAQRSAGLLVHDVDQDGALLVFLAHMGGPFWARREEAAWSLPKGLYGPDEEPLAAARREFAEEIGAPAPAGPVADLGEFVLPSRKRLRVFAVQAPQRDVRFVASTTFRMEWPPRSGRQQDFPEVDRAAWFTLAQARRTLVRGQLPVLDALAAALGGPGASV
jgi:predicted NUDIX family NTP pyrophosphohydrolase